VLGKIKKNCLCYTKSCSGYIGVIKSNEQAANRVKKSKIIGENIGPEKNNEQVQKAVVSDQSIPTTSSTQHWSRLRFCEGGQLAIVLLIIIFNILYVEKNVFLHSSEAVTITSRWTMIHVCFPKHTNTIWCWSEKKSKSLQELIQKDKHVQTTQQFPPALQKVPDLSTFQQRQNSSLFLILIQTESSLPEEHWGDKTTTLKVHFEFGNKNLQFRIEEIARTISHNITILGK
jgi:hypothetical protein